jgi:hypothetical protein
MVERSTLCRSSPVSLAESRFALRAVRSAVNVQHLTCGAAARSRSRPCIVRNAVCWVATLRAGGDLAARVDPCRAEGWQPRARREEITSPTRHLRSGDGGGRCPPISTCAQVCGIFNGAVAPASMTWVVPVT